MQHSKQNLFYCYFKASPASTKTIDHHEVIASSCEDTVEVLQVQTFIEIIQSLANTSRIVNFRGQEIGQKRKTKQDKNPVYKTSALTTELRRPVGLMLMVYPE